MAYSRIHTLLPLEEYARVMSIPGWHFNQVEHPGRPTMGACDLVWIQSGYSGDPNRIVGRDEIAQAIAEAEFQMANVAGFWPIPAYVCNEDVKWPDLSRGLVVNNPILKAKWGYIVETGTERWDQLNIVAEPVVYTDEDGDGYLDTATINFGLYLDDVDECEIVVTPHGYDPSDNWEIETLDITITGSLLHIRGPRWLFVDPDNWGTIDVVPMDDDPSFLTEVDIWRHYTYEYPAARIEWLADPCATVPCTPRTQDACIEVLRSRTSAFKVTPASFDGSTWTRGTLAYCQSPRAVKLWYLAGYTGADCNTCEIDPAIKRAIVSLANCYLSDAPCGCSITLERWERDRELQEMDAYNVAMAKSHFGTSARGAVFAYSVLSRIPKLGRGG